MKRAIGVLAVVLALGTGPWAGAGQVVPPPGGGLRRGQVQPPDRLGELEARVWARFGESVRAQLRLEPAKFRALQDAMQAFQAERQEVNRARASLRHRLRDPALPDLPEAEARALLSEMVRLQEKELDLYKREQVRLLEVLTPSQLVLFYRLREDFAQRIQELRQGRPGGPGIGAGIGGGPEFDGGGGPGEEQGRI